MGSSSESTLPSKFQLLKTLVNEQRRRLAESEDLVTWVQELGGLAELVKERGGVFEEAVNEGLSAITSVGRRAISPESFKVMVGSYLKVWDEHPLAEVQVLPVLPTGPGLRPELPVDRVRTGISLGSGEGPKDWNHERLTVLLLSMTVGSKFSSYLSGLSVCGETPTSRPISSIFDDSETHVLMLQSIMIRLIANDIATIHGFY